MEPDETNRRLAAILAADVAGYTRLIERCTLLAHETTQRFYDIGTPGRLETIEQLFLV